MRKQAAAEAAGSSGKKAKQAEVVKTVSPKTMVAIDPKLLQCGVCSGLLVPPIFQCTKGHITCSKCCPVVNNGCSLCKGLEDATRCHAMERLLGDLTVPCSFRARGCTEMILYSETLAHAQSCLYAPCYCPIAGCGIYAGRPSLHDHIMQDHPMLRYMVVPGVASALTMYHGDPACLVSLSSDGEMFLIVVTDDRSALAPGQSLSVIHLARKVVTRYYRIEVRTKAGLLLLYSEAQDVRRLMRAYEPTSSLFVSDAMWGPKDSPVRVDINIHPV
ncbi:putative E3 ubiquitin-protein ligase SINA-like 6 [Brachypodium distachyon]|uniref:RING-type E3 ubiquitin transferase n=1 Tax=Brachypodium distachyon TaxID=15368 RepID=A0A0Q3MDQ1_BRADI|nr:putative E3 ubiquitin-protein ligase SINA-like 6 [Brachypodium distachyon]KQK02470.1 hypothetical protein BRADI_2g01666v3 [Brachypodium distachyon]|eukprot:XP_010232939.1 putative E3 ubiquitin-protein ligase SINA-like 6 [Brachypodium distachyon]